MEKYIDLMFAILLWIVGAFITGALFRVFTYPGLLIAGLFMFLGSIYYYLYRRLK